MTVNATLTLALAGSVSGANDLAAVAATFAELTKRQQIITAGTGVNQCDKAFMDTRTLAASATENLDLAGALTDVLGAALTFAKIRAIMVFAKTDNVNDVVIGGAASNTFVGMFNDATDKIRVKPGGAFVWFAPQDGATVTAGTGDILLVANSGSGTPVSYDIVVLGTSS